MSTHPRQPRNDPLSPPRGRRARGPWKHGTVPVIGLVGGIGAGKSTVARLFESDGAHVIDADRVGHALLDQKPARERVVAEFGKDMVLGPDHESINRAALGAIVFGDPTARARLERILHPLMRRTFEKAISRAQRQRQARAIVLDAAILFEAGWDDLCDVVVFVDASDSARRQRVLSDRGWDEAAIARREAAQAPLSGKRDRADYVINNEGAVDELRPQVELVWSSLTQRFRATVAQQHAARRRQALTSQSPRAAASRLAGRSRGRAPRRPNR